MKPYKVKNNLWFYPVVSQNVPSFNGFYFPFPTNEMPSVTITDPSVYDEISQLYGYVNSTIFCTSDYDVEVYKATGFKNVINGTAFNDDAWEMNGHSYKVHFQTLPQGWDSGFGWGFTLGCGDNDYWENFGSAPLGGGGIVIFAPSAKESNSEGEITKYYSRRYTLTKNDSGFQMSAINTNNYNLQSDRYIWLWKDVVEAPPEAPKGIRIYKDIILMNGAKIYNEDGTEYTV